MAWNPRIHKVKKGIWVLAATLLILSFISFFIYKHYFERTVFTGKEKSIAVLPFVNMSGNKEKEYFSDGLTDEIINQLSKIAGLRVVSRNSVMGYKGKNKSIRQITDELHVGAILNGEIQKSESKLTLSIRLTDTNTGKLIWSEVYNREMLDIFSMQTELAELIADKLDAVLTSTEKNKIDKRPTQNLEAYDQFLKGRNAWNRGGDSALRKGIDFFKQAIKLDSSYAKAYSGLADCYSALGYNSFEIPSVAFLNAEAAAVKALHLDSSLADPHTSLGYIRFYYYWDWTGAEREFLNAIHLNPVYVLAYDSYGYYLTAMERFPESRVALDKAFELDPLSAKINTDLGFNFYYNRMYAQALTALKSSLEINNKLPLTHIWLGRSYQEMKMYNEANQQYFQSLKVERNWPVALAAIGYVYGISGKKAEAKKILADMVSLSTTKYVTPYGLALIYAGLNDRENTFKCLEKAYTDRSNWLVWLKLDPRWSVVSNDKRYSDLMKKVGLRATGGEFPKE